MNLIKEVLLSSIKNTADWRGCKAVEYPEDALRNNNSSDALLILHTHVEALPDDHSLFQVMEKCVVAGAPLTVYEKENYMISRYGFFRDPGPGPGADPEEFVCELTALYEQEGREAE